MSTPPESSPSSGIRGWWAGQSTRVKVIIVSVGAVVLLGIGASAGEQPVDSDQAQQESNGSATEGAGDDGAEGGSAEGGSDAAAEEECGDRATAGCTPRVGPDESVRVDALTWRVTDAQTRATIGDQEFGLGAEANGIYVIVDLEVSSARDESVTLTDGIVALEVNGNTYDPDTSGTTAAIGAGEDPLFLEDIGPDVTLESRVVFDVPESVLAADPELRFGELGLGSTAGYIALPSLD